MAKFHADFEVKKGNDMNVERITSRQNALIQQVRKLRTSRSERYKTGLFCADGTKLLQEAIRWCDGLHTVLLSEDLAIPALPEHVRVCVVPKELMEYASGMAAPQGALFLCRIPQMEKKDALQPGTLILDGLQDPGNLGTILRTADALQIPVVLSTGCADPYNEKTVRASMGAVFRTPPVQMSREEVLAFCKEAGLPLAVTAMSDDAVDLRQSDCCKYAVIIGSEGQGVCKEYMDAADARLIIPMNPRCESLNAAIAAAIVMWQMKQ